MSPEPELSPELLEDRVVSLAPVGRRPTRPAGRWVLLAGALVVALAAAVVSARWPSAPPLAAVASPSPALGLSAPTPVVAPVATKDGGPCGTGRIQVDPLVEPTDGSLVARFRPPVGGLLAAAIEQGPSDGSIVVSRTGLASTVSSVVATFHGRAVQDPYGVTVVGWSAAGDTMLVRSGHESAGSADRSCSDLFLVWADGSGVQYLTGNSDSDWIASTAFGPRTGQVAFVRDDELWVPDTEAANGFASIAPCAGAAPSVRWSPDERRLFAICDGWFVMAGASDPTALYPINGGITPMSAVWSSDSLSITLVSDNGAVGSVPVGPLAVLDLDFLTGVTKQRVETYTQAQWTVPSPFISPDGKWLVADAYVSAFADASSTALDLTTGATTTIPWSIPEVIEGRGGFAWLPDNETMLYADGAILYELNIREMTRTEVGSVPDPDFTWLNRAP